MADQYKKGQEIATIDVAMVTIDVALAAKVAAKSGADITEVTVVAETFADEVTEPGIYEFIYNSTGTTWKLDGANVDLADYGITVTGTPADGDYFKIDFTPEAELGLTTGTQVSVETDLETTDAIKLIVKGVLIAQKREKSTITGTTITLTDNVFNPQLVRILQGGTIEYQTVQGQKVFKKYTPPAAGENYEPIAFDTNLYTAHYDASGLVQGYEKVHYPNCTGQPVAFSAEDDTFSAPEYTIKSAPSTGGAPYDIEYVDDLPELVNYFAS